MRQGLCLDNIQAMLLWALVCRAHAYIGLVIPGYPVLIAHFFQKYSIDGPIPTNILGGTIYLKQKFCGSDFKHK